ncbi:MAG TPA: hypothetical protein VFQ39_03845 [Longimicrobium sp.]|nr:hypothetical protein [Longimicrobium sp.]
MSEVTGVVRAPRWAALRRGRWLPKPSRVPARELDDFLAAQDAAFADGRAYMEARRRRRRPS